MSWSPEGHGNNHMILSCKSAIVCVWTVFITLCIYWLAYLSLVHAQPARASWWEMAWRTVKFHQFIICMLNQKPEDLKSSNFKWHLAGTLLASSPGSLKTLGTRLPRLLVDREPGWEANIPFPFFLVLSLALHIYWSVFSADCNNNYSLACF